MADTVAAVLALIDADEVPERGLLKSAVKDSLAALVEIAPGRSVEVRIPPFAAVQAIPGATHRRGTPPAVVETDPVTWLLLCAGRLSWDEACRIGKVRASGERSDLSQWLPLFVA
ncbi:MAG: sterol carrier family protein [Candidatus Nanopelagicales bacterium]